MADFTDRRINQTYQRLVQVDNRIIQDGKGRTLSGSIGDLHVSGTLSTVGHSDVSASLSRLDYFSSSLDDTYARDAELAAVSSSLALETAQLLDFSASLDATFATDEQLDNVSSSLALETAQLLDFSASLDATFATDAQLSAGVDPLTAATSSYALKSAISGAFDITSASLASRIAGLDSNYATDTQLNSLSASISANYTTDAELTAYSSSVASDYLTNAAWLIASASIKQDTAYDSARIGALEAKRLVSSSRQITGALDTIYPRRSAQFTASYDTRYLQVTNWEIASGSIKNDISADSQRIAYFEQKRLVSSSRQITGALDTIYPRTTNAAISGSGNIYSASFASSITSLNAVTSSFLTSASAAAAGFGSGGGGGVSSYTDLTNVPGGILSSSAQVDALGYVTSSEASDFTGINNFTGSIQGEVDAIKVVTGSLQTEVNNLTAATSSYVSSSTVDFIQIMTSASYAAITPVSGTLYIIQG